MDRAKSFLKEQKVTERGQSLKSSISSKLGRNKEETSVATSHHVTPISSLRDPSTFAPPPKRTETALRPPPPPPPSAPKKPVSFHPGTDAYQGATKLKEPLPPPKWTLEGQGQQRQLFLENEPPPPSLPPRLPPRRNAGGSTPPVSPPPAATEGLAARGINIPALGIGSSQSTSHLSQGTTLAQKRAALKTAANLRNDPSKVTFSEFRSAATTADNFRQRHGDQVIAGAQKAQEANEKYDLVGRVGNLNTKYGLSEKVHRVTGAGAGIISPKENTMTEKRVLPPPAFGSNGPKVVSSPPPMPARPGTVRTAVCAPEIKKKAPPPPPPKKNLTTGSEEANNDTPPPIPYDTKPVF